MQGSIWTTCPCAALTMLASLTSASTNSSTMGHGRIHQCTSAGLPESQKVEICWSTSSGSWSAAFPLHTGALRVLRLTPFLATCFEKPGQAKVQRTWMHTLIACRRSICSDLLWHVGHFRRVASRQVTGPCTKVSTIHCTCASLRWVKFCRCQCACSEGYQRNALSHGTVAMHSSSTVVKIFVRRSSLEFLGTCAYLFYSHVLAELHVTFKKCWILTKRFIAQHQLGITPNLSPLLCVELHDTGSSVTHQEGNVHSHDDSMSCFLQGEGAAESGVHYG